MTLNQRTAYGGKPDHCESIVNPVKTGGWQYQVSQMHYGWRLDSCYLQEQVALKTAVSVSERYALCSVCLLCLSDGVTTTKIQTVVLKYEYSR